MTSPSSEERLARVKWRRFLRRTGIFALLLVGFLALSFWNYTPSQRAWEQYKTQLAAKGELIDWTNYVNFKMPPESENFGATPLLRRVGRKGQNDPELWARITQTGLGSQ